MKFTKMLAPAAAALALVLTGCGGSAGSGAGSEEASGPIKIGILADLTGRTADVGTPYNEGMLDYIEMRNESGGIAGRQIEPDSNDYAYDVARAEGLYNKYVSDGAIVIQGWGTPDSDALRSRVASDELPFMSGSLADVLADPAESPYTFLPFATYANQARVALDFINEDSGGTGEVAFFHIDSPAGTEPAKAAADWISEKGYDLGLMPYAMPSGSNFVGLLQSARQQGAKYVVIQHVSTPAAQVAKDIKAQGLDMKIVCLSICADEAFITTAGAENAEGSVLVNPVAPPALEKEGHAEMKAFLEGNGESLAEQNVHYVQGWYTMLMMSRGIEEVLDAGDELTGANIKAALEAMEPVETGGVSGDIDFTEDTHGGTTASGVYGVAGGKITELSAAVTP